jgi:hypothetical protein
LVKFHTIRFETPFELSKWKRLTTLLSKSIISTIELFPEEMKLIFSISDVGFGNIFTATGFVSSTPTTSISEVIGLLE